MQMSGANRTFLCLYTTDLQQQMSPRIKFKQHSKEKPIPIDSWSDIHVLSHPLVSYPDAQDIYTFWH